MAAAERILAGHLLPGGGAVGVIQAADALDAPPLRVLGRHLIQGWLGGLAAGHARPQIRARRCAIPATPPYKSAGWPNGLLTAGRHALTGTTPDGSNGNPPNSPLTWAWLRGVTGTGTWPLYAVTGCAGQQRAGRRFCCKAE